MRQYIYNEYVVNDKTRNEIIATLDVPLGALKRFLKRNHIQKEKLVITKEGLEKVIGEGKTRGEICKIFNCSKDSLRRRCKEYGLKVKDDVYVQYDPSNDEKMISMYEQGYSSTQIAKAFKLAHRTVLNHLIKNGIERRSLSDSQMAYKQKVLSEDLNDYDTMFQLHIVQKMPLAEIANHYGCTPRTVRRRLIKLGIDVKDYRYDDVKDTSTYIEFHETFKSTVRNRLRYLTKQAMERDGYKCRECGSTENLEVHHIKRFGLILRRILNEHKELNEFDKREELFQIVIHDEEMTDLDNLITLCQECHRKTFVWNDK